MVSKSCLRETPNLLTNVDRSKNIKKKINQERLLVFRALQDGPQMDQSTSPPAWTFQGCNLEQLLVFKALELVDECTSPLFKHLPHVDAPCMQSRTTPCL